MCFLSKNAYICLSKLFENEKKTSFIMPAVNPFTIADKEQFVVGRSNFEFFRNHPCHCDGGAILLCTAGSAQITINIQHDNLVQNSVALLLPDSTLMFSDASSDFNLSYCIFSRTLFSEAGFRLDPSFFRFLSENPIALCTNENVKGAKGWMQLAAYTYADKENIFRNTIIRNRLQNVFMEIYDKVQRSKSRQRQVGTNRQAELFHKFISFVHAHCAGEREVAFYADKLCVTTRYLSAISQNVSGNSAKQIIDQMVLLEIKVLLESTTLSIQEIADRLHFPDQSYLGRYFKKHIGKSPTDYRNKK